MTVQSVLSLLEERIYALFRDDWGTYQFVIVIVGIVLAVALARLVEPMVEGRARNIKGNPDLLRVVIAFMRRLRWVFFIAWLWLAQILIEHFTWPSRSWLVSKALALAIAWFVVAVLTRVIRNRSLARLVALGTWIYLALVLLGFVDEVTTSMNAAAITLGATRISLLSVVKGSIITAALIWAAVFIGNIVANRVERIDDVSPAIRVLLGKLTKIVLIVIAGAFALSATGIDLTAFTVLSGAIGVGLGFGLQKVVSNFISGIIILMDKSIKPGDTISLGETFGWIRELRARFVSVITRDGKEYLIPNEDFITQQVINWSFSSEYVRIDVDFGVAYSSDPHQVVEIAIATAKTIPRVTAYKAPVCWMTAFGSSSLDFKLRFWISDPANGLTNIRGEVLMALWDAFKDADIDIPFPHREVIMRTPVEVRIMPEEKTASAPSQPQAPD